MERLHALLEFLPSRELEIRRLYPRNEEFRGACEDYEVAVKALQHWECVEGDAVRAAEYRQLAAEIMVEITTLLDAASASTTTR